jgi:PAS domain S-box-containing protein
MEIKCRLPAPLSAKGRMMEGIPDFDDKEKFWLVADSVPAMIWMSGADQRAIYFNRRWLDFTGRTVKVELGNGWTESVHPEDRERRLEEYCRSFDSRQEFKIEYRLRRCDGKYRWMSDRGAPWFHADGSFGGYVGVCLDITDRKLREEEILDFSAGLIKSQEDERARITQALHDDIGGSLAVLGIEIQRAGRASSGAPQTPGRDWESVYEELQQIAMQISNLSHQLQGSATLEHLGLAQAIQLECREVSARSGMPIECSCNDVPARLDRTVGLGFLRVLQEALGNAVKHSRAATIKVEVIATSVELALVVTDDGVGFDADQGRAASGLGLISMRERMRLAGGNFEVRSQPGQGVKISCRAPIASTAVIL